MKLVLRPLNSSVPIGRTPSLLIGFLTVSIGVWAQTQSASTSILNAFSEESVITPANIDSVTASGIPPDVLAAITAGAQELHQTINYVPSQSALQITAFVEPVGSAVPTPPSPVPPTTLWSYTVSVMNTVFASQPKKTVTFVGVVSSSQGAAFGNLTGANIVVSAAYAPVVTTGTSTPATPTQFSAVTTNIVGSAALFASSGLGNLNAQTAAPAGLTAVAGPKGMQTSSATFQLNGSQSSDPNGGKLTYQWTFLPFIPGQTVQFDDPTLPNPTITFPQNDPFAFGDYTFQLTVTNPSGATATDTVTVTYVASGS